jgi:predicted RNase H-like nuclease
LSIQSFSIFAKIREANQTITPELQDWCFEIHPEICFWALAGGPMVHPKRRPAGYNERRDLLEAATGLSLPDRAVAFAWAKSAQPDDLLDALVAAWTAKRRVEGRAGRLGGDLSNGPGSLRMEMVY